jgi:hypothetical protein
MSEEQLQLLEKLYLIRKWDVADAEHPIPFNWPKLLRKTIWDTENDCDTKEPLVLRQYQLQALIHLARMSRFFFGEAIGLGKTCSCIAAFCWLKERNPQAKMVVITTKSTAQPLTAKILTPTGWTTMGEIKIGDPVVDPDGGVGYVEGVYPQGEKDIYRVTTVDGGVTTCSEDHLWLVKTPHTKRTNRFKVLDTKEMLKRGVRELYRGGDGKTWWGNKFILPFTKPVEFSSSVLPLSAYVMGVLLGDGSTRWDQAIIYAQETHVPRRISLELPSEYKISKQAKGQYSLILKDPIRNAGNHARWHVRRSKLNPACKICQKQGIVDDSTNIVLREFVRLGLWGKFSFEKFIPEMYLQASVKDRIALLQGLMDTDGNCKKDGQANFTTTSSLLRDGVVHLARSLGGVAFISAPIFPKENSLGLRVRWNVTVNVPFNPFSMSRKANRWRQQRLVRSIQDISLVGFGPVQCIKVSTKRHLYVTDDYIVTHNTWQWKDEILRFSTLHPRIMEDAFKGLKSSAARYAQMTEFLEGNGYDVLICKYDSLRGTRKKIEGKFDADGNPINGRERISEEILTFSRIFKRYGSTIVLALDEGHKFSSQFSQVYSLVSHIAKYPERVWVITATAIKNNLLEFYTIAHAIGVRPLGSVWDFRNDYCRWRDQYVGRGVTKKLLVGYNNVAEFKKQIRPFFLGRSQAQVKEPLPRLTTVYHPVDLDKRQTKILTDELPNGTLQLPPAVFKAAGEWRERERDPENLFTQLSVQQLVANHWCLLDPDNETDFNTKVLSPKEECLLDLLDGDLRGEKVVVFTKYLRWINRLDKLTSGGHFTGRKFLRITGEENEKQRDAAKKKFQDPNSGYDLIFINTAGLEGINLQQAGHMVVLDVPWGWGSLLQLIGRMVRMSSPHSACTLHITVAKGTVDEYAVDTLRGKKGIFEIVLGQSHSSGILDDQGLLDLDSGMEAGGSEAEFRQLLYAHVKKTCLGKYLSGDRISRAMGGDDYQMVFERKAKKKAKAEKPTWGEIHYE